MITFHVPRSIDWLFSPPKECFCLQSCLVHRIKIIFLGSILSLTGAAEQGVYTIKVLGKYCYSKINPRISEKPTFLDVLLEAYKTVGYIIGILALPILGIIIAPQSIIGLYEKLHLYKISTEEKHPVQHPQNENTTKEEAVTLPKGSSNKPTGESAKGDPKEEYKSLPLSDEYLNLKKKYDNMDTASKKTYLQLKFLSIPLEEKKNLIYALLDYFDVNKDKFNSEDGEGYHRLSEDFKLKEELELQIVTSDVTNKNLPHKLGNSLDSRNVASRILRDLVKSSDLFPDKSEAYKQLLAFEENSNDIFNAMEPLKKDIFKSLLVHLQSVASFEKQHKMGPKNLAIVFAPNLDSEPDIHTSASSVFRVTKALTKMIEKG